MIDRSRFDRMQLWLWLALAWIAVPALTILAVRRFGDYSAAALWRWGFLMLWALVMPTIGAMRQDGAVRRLRQSASDPQSPAARLPPAWHPLAQGVLTAMAIAVLAVYYER